MRSADSLSGGYRPISSNATRGISVCKPKNQRSQNDFLIWGVRFDGGITILEHICKGEQLVECESTQTEELLLKLPFRPDPDRPFQSDADP